MKPIFIRKYIVDSYVFNVSICRFGDYAELEYFKDKFNKIVWKSLSKNPNAIHILEKNIDKINWCYLASNPNAIPILENNLDKIDEDVLSNLLTNPNLILILDKLNRIKIQKIFHERNKNKNWDIFSKCPCIIDFLDNINIDQIQWEGLSTNIHAIPFLEKHIDKICWTNLSQNPNAISILEKHLNKVSWMSLCTNPNAMEIIENNFHKVEWMFLSKNPNAIHVLEKNLDKISWRSLSSNKNAIKLLEQNLDKIDWYFLTTNPNSFLIINNYNYSEEIREHEYNIMDNYNSPKIFLKLDYEKMKENNALMTEEIVSKVFNPNRLVKLCNKYNMTFDEINDCY